MNYKECKGNITLANIFPRCNFAPKFLTRKMSRIVLLATAIIAVSSAMTEASAQISKKCIQSNDGGYRFHLPHRSIRPHRQIPVRVSYDDSSTLLTVNFPSNTEGGIVEVFCNGSKVAGIATGGGTTFSCTLKDYGAGTYNIIVSNKKTVVYTKTIVVSK
jgi:hypothetical protein